MEVILWHKYSIRIATQSIGFTCTYGAGVHYHPRPLIDEHVPSDAAYNPTTGVVTFTVAQTWNEEW